MHKRTQPLRNEHRTFCTLVYKLYDASSMTRAYPEYAMWKMRIRQGAHEIWRERERERRVWEKCPILLGRLFKSTNLAVVKMRLFNVNQPVHLKSTQEVKNYAENMCSAKCCTYTNISPCCLYVASKPANKSVYGVFHLNAIWNGSKRFVCLMLDIRCHTYLLKTFFLSIFHSSGWHAILMKRKPEWDKLST